VLYLFSACKYKQNGRQGDGEGGKLLQGCRFRVSGLPCGMMHRIKISDFIPQVYPVK